MLQAWWEDLYYFKHDEQYKTGSGLLKNSFPEPEKMNEALLRMLDRARGIAGVTFTITSSYRPGDPRSHGKGLAVDIRVKGSLQRLQIVQALLQVGFVRLGVYDLHIHADVDRTLPKGMWTGKSS